MARRLGSTAAWRPRALAAGPAMKKEALRTLTGRTRSSGRCAGREPIYPLKGSPRVTSGIHKSGLFRVAEDIVDRVGIRQGVLAADDADDLVATEGILSVTEAAKELGITRSAVIKAAQAGRLKGKKIGSTWAILKRSVAGYQVAEHRVAAGRAAHRR